MIKIVLSTLVLCFAMNAYAVDLTANNVQLKMKTVGASIYNNMSAVPADLESGEGLLAVMEVDINASNSSNIDLKNLTYSFTGLTGDSTTGIVTLDFDSHNRPTMGLVPIPNFLYDTGFTFVLKVPVIGEVARTCSKTFSFQNFSEFKSLKNIRTVKGLDHLHIEQEELDALTSREELLELIDVTDLKNSSSSLKGVFLEKDYVCINN